MAKEALVIDLGLCMDKGVLWEAQSCAIAPGGHA